MFDVIIIGAGPAGSTAAMFLGRTLGKDRVLLVDKARFPRDKTCGDAQGRKAARILKELSIYEGYEKLPGHVVYGITLSSPNGTIVSIDVEKRDKPAPGFVHRRQDFDNFLFNCAKKDVTFKEMAVEDIIVEKGSVAGIVGISNGKKEEIRARLVIAADGAYSVIARKFGVGNNPPEHLITATRAYYKNVKGLTDRIEIHLVKDIIPGYFWIFPLDNGECNVGLGMIVRDMNKKKMNLVEAQIREIKENPLFKERFKDSKLIGEIKGWILPVASYKRKILGSGYMLAGDAAGLIDPLSGEGVGNAMISGRLAALTAIEAIKKNDVSEKSLKRYDEGLWEEIGPEIKANYRVQRLGKMFPHLIDRLVVKASKDENYRKKLEEKLPYALGRREMGESSFLKELGHEGEELGLEIEGGK